MQYKRVLLKLSGESLAGNSSYGIEQSALELYADEIVQIANEGIQTAIVLGGGNIFRGIQGMDKGVDRVQGDYMGMLATVINSVAMQSTLKRRGVESTVLSGLPIDPVCEKMSASKAIKLLQEGHVVIIAGGTGNPFFTTDTAAALRAVEINADVILKGTRVDGVYDKDPEKHQDAVKYDELTFEEAYKKNLKIMDLTAFTLCKENNIPVIVFNINTKGNLTSILLKDKNTGTLVKN
ncbi:MAG: UMP kinase [Bacteroidetes bacterium]|nr:UMP kinase [Bacteroidota bacterium]